MTQIEQILSKIDRLIDEKGTFYAKDVLYELKDFVENLSTPKPELGFSCTPKFKKGDRIRLIGTNVKGDVIKNIYTGFGGLQFYEFEGNSDDLSIAADNCYEIVE